MKVYKIGKLPIKSWMDEIGEETLNQAINLSNLDYAYRHIALMPDGHTGFGMPIGGILASKGYIVPNAVGVDIGCGVLGVRTDIYVEELLKEDLEKIINKAYNRIPLGFKSHKKPREWLGFEELENHPFFNKELDKARRQLGTLGGGNHFLSFEKGSDGYVWILVHSGSRNLGHTIATHYNNLAKDIDRDTPFKDLAALDIESIEGKNYFRDMELAMSFARENRRQLFEDLYILVEEVLGKRQVLDLVECHHNYASLEEHFGEKVLVHRKGAINAELGRRGIIPGSMGTPSYIVEGLGNSESFNSSSHGAGRSISRTEANKIVDREEYRKSMEGIIYREGKDLSEAPMAYKDIESVIKMQEDLTKILVKLEPLGVIKG